MLARLFFPHMEQRGSTGRSDIVDMDGCNVDEDSAPCTSYLLIGVMLSNRIEVTLKPQHIVLFPTSACAFPILLLISFCAALSSCTKLYVVLSAPPLFHNLHHSFFFFDGQPSDAALTLHCNGWRKGGEWRWEEWQLVIAMRAALVFVLLPLSTSLKDTSPGSVPF